jgi:glucokinase
MNGILAVDIGGTKTFCQLSTAQNEVLVEREYVSQQFASFEALLGQFLSLSSVEDYTVISACFAVAGPVSDRDATVTNLPWQFNADRLAAEFGLDHVHLCNDFEAVAMGISCLADDEIITLNQGESQARGARAVIGAGTGLGQALLLPEENGWRIVATEGGHADFAPRNDLQIALLSYLRLQFGHVSYERIVSGAGLVSIYHFLCQQGDGQVSTSLQAAMAEGDAAAAISRYALIEQDALASQALDLFIDVYGAQAGNLALTVLSRGGLYIAGGIAAKNVQRFQDGRFMAAFTDKGKMAELVKMIPVKLIIQDKVGLKGAHLLAMRSAL